MGSESASDTSTTDTPAQEGVLDTVKHQIDEITGSSITDTKNNLAAVSGDTVNGLKEAVREGVPAAVETLQSAEERIRSLAGGKREEPKPAPDEDTESYKRDAERIDQMDTELISDFLRDKYRSTKPPPSTK